MILFIALDLKNKTWEIVVKLYISYRHHLIIIHRHDITEMSLKVALNTITITL